MDDDTAPRQAPPPKPSTVPLYGTPKPVVPEVSLMFDSEDSLIWQKPKSGTPVSLLQRKDLPHSKPGYLSSNAKSHTPPPIIKNQISEKTYNPMVYSPSQKNVTNKELGHSIKGIPPAVTRSVVPISRVLTQTQNTVTSPPYASSNVTSKNIAPDPTIKFVHFHDTPKVPDDGTPQHVTRLQQHQKNLLAYRNEKENIRPQSPVSNEFRNTDVPTFLPQYRKEMHTAMSVPCNPGRIPEQPTHHYPLNDMKVIPHLEHVSNLHRDKSNNQVDQNIYHLIEKQNEHIFKLQTLLEKLLEKQQHDEVQRNREGREMMKEIIVALNANQPVNQKQIFKDTCVQTEDNKPETCSVGTNTDILWSDLIGSSQQETLGTDDKEKNLISDSREHVKIAAVPKSKQEAPTDIHRNHFKAKQLNKRDIPMRQATNWTVHKEMSLTMQEVVMKTIEEDPPSPDPSVHISMTEYQDGSKHEEVYGITRNNRKSTDQEGSPVLGESASTCSPTHDSPHERAKPTGPTGVTFYNNVMTNIQHILQTSKSAEEEDGKREDTPSLQRYPRPNETGSEAENSVPDPQMEAVRKQLMQFGISFIDPATLAPNNRPVMDTMYLPGLHNMLSMYQNTLPSSTVSPYQETDATAAKYLTDAQLAAIAAASPAMRDRTRATREMTSEGPPHQQKNKNTATENNYSIATKKFLGKYGLHDNLS